MSALLAVGAAALALFAATPASAQQIGLRKTVSDDTALTSPLLKKKKKRLQAGNAQVDPGAEMIPMPTARPDVEDNANTTTATAAPNPEPVDADADPLDTGIVPVEGETMRPASLAEEEPAAVSRLQSDGSLEQDAIGPLGRENEKTGSIEGKAAAADADPFAAPGIRSGSFLIRPTLEAGVRYQSADPNNPSGSGSTTSAETSVTMRAQSDWLRHALNIEMRGTVQKPLSSGSGLSSQMYSALRLAVDGRIDASVDDTISYSASIDRARETLSATSSTGYNERPVQTTMRAAAGYTHDAGALAVSVNGQLTRNTYGDAISLTGTTLPQDDRDNTLAALTLRGTYDSGAVFSPFAEVEIGRRIYDNKTDSLGVRRSTNRYAGRLGVEFARSDKLTGELAAGWFVENPDDTSLKNTSGLDMRGTVNWSPVRDTTVRFVAGTSVEGASSTTAESSVTYTASAEITRKLRPNLDANLLLSTSLQDYTGVLASQTTMSVEGGATWWMSRYAGINGRLGYTHVGGGSSRDATTAYLGLILRR